ncbi:MAG TPA: response regulator [Ktedonobacterales bacterium]|nr:response regulator [Ktedonobacterales bacterium]
MESQAHAAGTVLVVDDNPRLLAFIADALQELGDFRVVTAANGARGLELFYDVQPDCMVIDVKMPGLDGYQLVRALRGDPTSAATALIILTAMTQEKDRMAGMLSGADQYLLKPVDPLDLVAAISRAVAMSADERRHRIRTLAEESPGEH